MPKVVLDDDYFRTGTGQLQGPDVGTRTGWTQGPDQEIVGSDELASRSRRTHRMIGNELRTIHDGFDDKPRDTPKRGYNFILHALY